MPEWRFKKNWNLCAVEGGSSCTVPFIRLASAIILTTIYICCTDAAEGVFSIKPTKSALSPADFFDRITSRRIPKFIFRTSEFPLERLPRPIANILSATIAQNVNYTQVYFNGTERKAFVRDYFPQYLGAYDVLIPGAFQADVFRLLVLYQFGGIYCDISLQFLKPVSHIVTNDDEFVAVKEVNNWGIQQTIIASYPRHALVKAMIDLVIDMIMRRDYSDSAIDITGPYAIYRAFNRFFRRKPFSPVAGGSYSIHGYKVKLLYHLVPKNTKQDNATYISRGASDWAAPDIKKKFDGYRELFGSLGLKHYAQLWKERKVFRDDDKISNTGRTNSTNLPKKSRKESCLD
jgi:mannosyltransferase OCH1-like enzyme